MLLETSEAEQAPLKGTVCTKTNAIAHFQFIT